MDERLADSWTALQDLVFDGMWNSTLGRFRADTVYRGEGRAGNELTTSLQRLGGPYAELERHLLRNFRKYAHRDAVTRESTWDWLALAKHHGLPTRLLDWSHSPYVALHFATEDPALFDVDGAVWIVDYVRAADHLPPSLRSILDDEGSNTFTADMLSRAANGLAELDGLSDDDYVVFYEPPSLDARITNQFAAFTFMSTAEGRLDHWLAARDRLARRVILPAALKWEIRDKLDQANVTERVLFPGLEGIARWLRRHYSPRA
ncbi:MAG: FRG domain-containing protein [Gaiella sp.]